ncbi:MAG: NlpC/P60 family protein, partial [Dokdonella sp.]
GIYLDNGRFIHSPSTGKSVSISNLDETYWAKRFAGAKRPNGLS